jgi:hypothetical protein
VALRLPDNEEHSIGSARLHDLLHSPGLWMRAPPIECSSISGRNRGSISIVIRAIRPLGGVAPVDYFRLADDPPGAAILRTHAGTAHGSVADRHEITFSEARLAVNSAGVLATFMMESLLASG